MGKITETIINRFDGGIVNDPRDPAENTCRIVSNFDIITNPKKMTPYRDSEAAGVASIADDKRNFCLAYWTPATAGWRLFGLGVTSAGGAIAEIAMKTLTTGGSTDLSDNTWAAPAGNASASGTTSMNLFVYYHKTGKIYGARADTHIWAF